MRKLLLLVLLLCSAFGLRAEYLDSDSIDHSARYDSLAPLHGNWFQQLMQTNFHINDPRIKYPRFPQFCLKVYNWGDKTFNSYDPAYVRSTGKNWKFLVKCDAWNQSFRYVFDLFNHDNVEVRSKMNVDLGMTIQFMAVGLTYTRAMDESIYGKKNKRNTFEFSFTCSRFSLEALSRHTSGGAYIDKYGSYDKGTDFLRMPFEGLETSTTQVTGFYFFNHQRYSQSAAYAYSKYQLRSAGSWLGGLQWAHRKVIMDFSDLPDDMKEANPEFPLINTFDYKEYALVGGYAYNWVLNKHFLFNITLMPFVGYRRSQLHTEHRRTRELVSAGALGRTSLTYNNGMLFVGLVGKFNGGFILNRHYSLFNSTQTGNFIIGLRF